MELDVLTTVGQHQNLVAFYGACVEDESSPVILEEYVEGPNLEKYLEVHIGDFAVLLSKCTFEAEGDYELS